MTASLQRIKWNEVIEAVKEELQNFDEHGYKPTLRAMFYRLFSRGIIPNTSSAYDRLSKTTVRARMEDELEIDCFIDNSRQIIDDYNKFHWTPEDLIDARVENLKNTEFDYTKFFHRWHNQPHYVEVWIEKDAMAGVFQTILQGKDVTIVPMKGNASLTFLNECVERLAHFENLGKKVHILYYGDFDPSGDYMDTDLENRLRGLGLEIPFDADFERIAVTQEQIDDYNLPSDPDKATREKMDRDTKSPQFIEKYGKLYAVELDSLPALIPDVFRQELVIDQVEQYFDERIYQELIDEYTPEDMNKLLKDKIRRLAEDKL
jgi:hypothetical protein